MPSEPAVISKSRLWVRLLIVFVIGFDVAAFWQWMGGAYESEFGARPDEGAQYVAGRYARDVIAQSWRFRGGSPDAAIVDGDRDGAGSALERYSIAPGRVWPPGFAVVQSAWYAVFGGSRLSVLLLLAALAAGVTTLLYGAVCREFGGWAAMAGALLWLCASLVRESYGMVMPAMLGTFAMLGATLAWGRFLDEGRARDAIWFGILAALAVLTEAAGLALGLMAAGSLAASWRWRRLANWAPWVAAILIVAAGLFVHAPRFPELVSAVRPTFAQAAAFYGATIAFSAGIAVTAFAIAGICFRVFSRGERRGRAAAIPGLVLSVFAYH